MVNRRTILALLAVTLFGCLGGLIATLKQPVRYQAQAYAVVYGMPRGFTELLGPSDAMQVNDIYQAGVTQDAVVRLVQQTLPGYTADALKRDIQVEVVAYTPLTRIIATAPTAEEASTLANVVAASWTSVVGAAVEKAFVDTKVALETRADLLTQQINNGEAALAATDPTSAKAAALQAQIQTWRDSLSKTLADSLALETAHYYVAGNAQVPISAKPTSAQKIPDLKKNLAAGAAIGFALGLLLALWIASRQWHRRQVLDVKRVEQARETTPLTAQYGATDGQ